jgi:hypothetical protein
MHLQRPIRQKKVSAGEYRLDAAHHRISSATSGRMATRRVSLVLGTKGSSLRTCRCSSGVDRRVSGMSHQFHIHDGIDFERCRRHPHTFMTRSDTSSTGRSTHIPRLCRVRASAAANLVIASPRGRPVKFTNAHLLIVAKWQKGTSRTSHLPSVGCDAC